MTQVYTQFEMTENQRVIETPYSKVYLKREDPFGFWRVEFSKGKVPKTLSGNYTTAMHAERDVLSYLNNVGREVVSKNA